MAWPVEWYTSFNSIRGILGVSDEEGALEDDYLGGDYVEASLHLALTALGSALPADFAAAKNVAYASRTEAQQTLALLVPMFAALAVARAVGPSLPMLAKTITDGKASFSRFADAPYKETLARVEAEYWTARSTLAETYAAITGGTSGSVAMPTFLVGAGASVDRVTNA